MNQPLNLNLTKGLIGLKHVTDGIELDCWLDYEPAEGDGWNEPHTGERMTLVYATLNGVDIFSLLADETVDAIEGETLNRLKSEAFDAAADQAADRAEFEAAYA